MMSSYFAITLNTLEMLLPTHEKCIWKREMVELFLSLSNPLVKLFKKSQKKSNITAGLNFYLKFCLSSLFDTMFCFRWTKWVNCCSLLMFQSTLWLLKFIYLTVFFKTIAKMATPLQCSQYIKMQKKTAWATITSQKTFILLSVLWWSSNNWRTISSELFYLSCWPGSIFNSVFTALPVDWNLWIHSKFRISFYAMKSGNLNE